jgi:hypothetical protein
MSRLPKEIHFIIRKHLDGYSRFRLSRLSGYLRSIYLVPVSTRAMKLRPQKPECDEALRRLLGCPRNTAVDGLGFHGCMAQMLSTRVDPSHLTWLTVTKPTSEGIDWLYDHGRGLQFLQRVEIRQAEDEDHVRRIVSDFYHDGVEITYGVLPSITCLHLYEPPPLDLEWLEGRQTNLEELVLDDTLHWPNDSLRTLLRASPRLKSLTLLGVKTATLDALGWCIEDRNCCEHLEVLTLRGHKGASALTLMQVLARCQPPKLQHIHLHHISWCEQWPKHLPRVTETMCDARKRKR